MKIAAYNQTYNELTVVDEGRRYVYEKVTPYVYHRLEYLIGHKWYGRAWGILKILKKKGERNEVVDKRDKAEAAEASGAGG